jgi:hypothetical protein
MIHFFGANKSIQYNSSESVSILRQLAQIVGVQLFYNDSALDANGTAVDTRDFAAIAADKAPLLLGGAASFANISGYSKGINGLFIDVSDLPNDGAGIGAADILFSSGNDDLYEAWTAAPSPKVIGVLADQGAGGADRIFATFDDRAISKTWLRIQIKAGSGTGLAADRDFFFGSAPGETGAGFLPGVVGVDAADLQSIARNLTPLAEAGTESAGEPNDVNRDGTVNAFDFQVVATNLAGNVINLISLGDAMAQFSASATLAAAEPDTLRGKQQTSRDRKGTTLLPPPVEVTSYGNSTSCLHTGTYGYHPLAIHDVTALPSLISLPVDLL